MSGREVVVIGGGFAGLAAAGAAARHGHHVTLIDKNKEVGGRARVWHSEGFTFDMGPSFYWMPEVFERYFQRFGRRVSDLYDLVRLDPSYRIVFGKGDQWALPAGVEAVGELFEREEPGASKALHAYMQDARIKYDLGMGDLVYAPSLSWREYARPKLLSGLLRTRVFRPLRSHVHASFRSRRIRQVMEFPALFLGAAPQHTPALFSLMNHADLALGTWYPLGGMGSVVRGMAHVAREQGVVVRTEETVQRIEVRNGGVSAVHTDRGRHAADVVIATADYQHVEDKLLDHAYRTYSPRYWRTRTMAPGTLLFYLGIDRKVPGADHHMLFFDASLDAHSEDIYTRPGWPREPLFYTSWASRTDPAMAPEGGESLVVLIPIAAGLQDDEAMREHYYNVVMDRLRDHLGIDLRGHVVVKRSYCTDDLVADHNAFRGNAYGLANTLRQTGPLRPRMKSRRVRGLYYAGQLTVPGPGVPPAIISGQVVADLLQKDISHEHH